MSVANESKERQGVCVYNSIITHNDFKLNENLNVIIKRNLIICVIQSMYISTYIIVWCN